MPARAPCDTWNCISAPPAATSAPLATWRTSTEIDDSVGESFVPTTLQQIGINPDDDEAIQRIAERTVIPGESSHNEPFEVTAAAVADAIRAADQQGRAYIN